MSDTAIMICRAAMDRATKYADMAGRYQAHLQMIIEAFDANDGMVPSERLKAAVERARASLTAEKEG